MFCKGSRYQTLPQHTITNSQGRTVAYVPIRFIPPITAFSRHTVQQKERLDLIAHQHFRDPEIFWRICDANLAMLPDDLVAQPNRQILIPSPTR